VDGVDEAACEARTLWLFLLGDALLLLLWLLSAAPVLRRAFS